jgi:hypothetical protein
MSKNVAVPEDLYAKAAEFAAKDHVSIEELVSSALVDQFNARQYLEQRSRRASREQFLKALANVPDIEPEANDRL